jgi:DNA-binding response OmpR family regulator
MTPSRVLVVDDEPQIRRALRVALRANGYDVTEVETGQEALDSVAVTPPDLLILDLGLPDVDGFELCAELRERHVEVVVVVVTARTDEADAVRALDGGADDFVMKPFRPVELLARLRAHMRRRGETGPQELRAGPVRLDQGSRRAWVRDQEITLRPKEHELLAVLVADAGRAVRRERLMDEVWDEHWSGSTKTLDVHVANVRRKLADAGDRWDRIATLRGYGYRFELD